jgi:WD40 repeat protein
MSDPLRAKPPGDWDTWCDPGLASGDLSRLLDDQWRRWAGGERVLVEEYLPAFAHLLNDPDALLDLLYHEVVVREQFGDAPELGEYLRRFPQLGRQLRDQFELHLALKSVRWSERGGSRWPGAVTLASTRPEAAGAGPSIPGYEIIRELGQGGMGVVYLAWQTGPGRLVALKMLPAGAQSRPQNLARFRDEVEAVARLEHPHLVRIYEVGAHDGRPFFSMEYVDGGSLTDSLRGTPWSPRGAAGLTETLACAAHEAHERGVVHRDLTPHNVLLTTGGAPKIVDFGLAKLMVGGACRTETGEILGTPSYMAPEQAGGRSKEVGPAADVYALGAILYELLTGRPPFQAETPLDTLVQALHDEPVSLRRLQPTVPRDLETICLKCLHKEPAHRYPTASALADDLHRFLAGEPVRARPVGAVGRAARWARRRPTVATLLAVCATLAALGFAVVTWEGRKARSAQRRAEQAQKAEKVQRIAAETARGQEAEQRRLYQGLSASLLRDRALRHCEDGDVGRGLLWLAQSLQLVPDNDADLQRAIRTNLAGWQGQIHPLLGLLEHDDRVSTAVWSPDGCLILTAGADRAARLWDPSTGQLRGQPLRHSRGVCAAAFSPDGATLLTVSGQDVRLWRTATGKATVVSPALDLGRGGQYLSHAFSRDGRQLWMATRRGPMTWLQSWETNIGQPRDPEVEIGKGVTRVTFSPDGLVFVTSGESADVVPRLWKSDTGKPVRDLKEHTHFGVVVAFPKDGRSFVTGSYDHTCRLWDAATGEPLKPPFRHLAEVRAVAISPNGRTILAGGIDGLAQFWDVIKGTSPGAPMRHPAAVGPVGFSPDGRFALTVSRDQVYLWDAVTGEPLGAPLPHQQEVLSASFEPDGRAVLTRSRDHTVRVWQTAPAQPGGRRLVHNGWVTAAAFRPQTGTSLLTGLGAREGRVLSWDMDSDRKPSVTFKGLGPILCLAYRPDGRMFAVGTRDGQVRFWDVEAGRPVRDNPLPLAGRVLSMAFSPDGRTLLTGTEKRQAEFWDVTTGERRPEPLKHGKAVYAVAYSPDGRTIGTGGEDMTARLWDAVTHSPVSAPLVHQGTVYAVAFCPSDGRVLLTGSEDRTARLWDTATGRPLGAPFQHPARVLAVAFSPDGRTFATGCGDGLVRLWETATGYPIGLPLRHRGPVRAVAFGPLPRDAGAEGVRWTLVTGSEDKTARCWEVPTPLTGPPEQIVHTLQVAHGLELDAQGVVEPLPPATWWRLRREILAAGGPPWLQPGCEPSPGREIANQDNGPLRTAR